MQVRRETVLQYIETDPGNGLMKRLVILASFVVVALASAELMAGHFRRHPQIATSASADKVGGLDKTKDGLPPMPPPDGDQKDKPKSDDPMAAEAEEPEGDDGKDDEPKSELDLFLERFKGNDWITLEYVYTGDVWNNARGGLRTRNATTYRGNLDVTLTARLDELEHGPGGVFFMYFENGHGRGPTQRYTGDWQYIDNIDAQDFVGLQELWWDKVVFEDFMRVRVGKMDGSLEFGVLDLGGDFLNASFGITPTLGTLPQFPYTTFGVVSFWQLTDELEFKVGVLNGSGPIDPLPKPTSRYFGGKGDRAFTIGQLTYRTDFDGKPGDAHVGVWYDGQSYARLPDGIERRGNHGVYMGAEQMLWKENAEDEEDAQGFGVFVQYGWCPDDINLIRYHIGGGAVWKGLIEGRDDDTTGIGITRAEFSEYLPGQGAETTTEFFYKAPLNKYLTLQPDVQYVSSPNGMLNNAWVFGLRFEAAL